MINQKEIVIVHSIEDFDKVKNRTKIKYNCANCQKECISIIRPENRLKQRRLLCKQCAIEATNLEKYGCKNPLQNKDIVNNRKETCLIKYGTNSVTNTESFKQKRKATLISKYGSDNIHNIEEIKSKIEQTNLKRFGHISPFGNDAIQEKAKKSNQKNNGFDRPTRPPKYMYNSIKFDSGWELAFYLYYTSLGYNVEREPCYFTYIIEEKEHKYYPDFRIGSEYYEIKGNQFINKDGKALNIFKGNDKLMEAKFQCAKEHNVKFIYMEEIKPILHWVKDTFGRDFLSKCKN